MDDKIEIGQRIKQVRKQLGISKVILAKKTGFGASRLGNWEAGIRTPKIPEAKKLSGALGVSAAFLLGLEEREEHCPRIPLFTETEIQEQLSSRSIIQMHAQETLPLPKACTHLLSKDAFAFTVADDSMHPLLKKGTIAVFLPHQAPKHNDIVLVSVPGIAQPIIRKYFLDNSCLDDVCLRLIPEDVSWGETAFKDQALLMVHGVLSGYKTIIY